MNTTNTNTKTSHGVKNLVVKAYVKGTNVVNPTYETACRLVEATPAIWDKASQEANAELDQIFADLGL